MTISTGARSTVSLVTESTFGTTPTTPSLVGVPFTSFSVNKTTDRYEDQSVRGDKMQRFNVAGSTHVTGDLDVNFSHTNFDGLIESAMNSTWSSNVIKSGSTRKSFTFENGINDLATPQYFLYTGMVVDKLALTCPNNGIVTAKFSMLGQNMTVGTTSVDGDGATAATAEKPYTHIGGTFKEGGSAVGYLTSITVNIDNGTSQNFALGSSLVRAFTTSWFKVSGNVTITFEDASLVNKYLNGTASSLEFTLTDGTNTFNVLIPNVIYTQANKSISGQGPITLSLAYEGLYDSTTGSNIVLTRSA